MKKIWLFLGLTPLLVVPAVLYTYKAKNVAQTAPMQPAQPTVNTATEAVAVQVVEPVQATPTTSTPTPVTKQTTKHTPKKKNCTTATPNNKTAEPTKQTAPTAPAVTGRMVTINNTICKDKLGYKHWGMWYHPSKFILSFNGKVVEQESQDSITIPADNKLKVHYDYEFLGGMRKGWRTLVYSVEPHATHLDIDFNWKDEYPVKITNAKPVSSDGKNS